MSPARSGDNHATYGDIHSVDAVIEYSKQSATSVLKIDVQNLDPTLTQAISTSRC
ncbi:MAG: hypothetical protein R3F14_23740 [Polyangiaceae bacterium]